MPQNIQILNFKGLSPCNHATGFNLDDILEIEKSSFISPWTKAMFEAELKNPAARFMVWALEGGKLAGYVLYWVLENETNILNIAVANPFRRQGIAKRMLQYVEDDSLKNNSCSVFLEVRPSSIEALGLYLSNGFKQIATRKKYYITEDALILHKKLGASPR